jgi:hypothetical protein
MSEQFEGAIVGGKEFPFIRITVASQAKILKKFKPSFWGAIAEWLWPERNNLRMWKKVRSIAFVKDWKWKYLRIMPKELRCKELNLNEAGGIKADFFAYARAKANEHDAPLLSLSPSKTENAKAK